MRSTPKTSEIPEKTKTEFIQAIAEWVKSLPSSEARSPSVYVSGLSYSPQQILSEIEHGTEFGREFLSDLYTLNRRMAANQKNASIVTLIRQSI
jgi:hypothetical protein